MKITDIQPKQDDPQRILALNGVEKKFYLSAEEINLILIVLSQLLGNETSLYKGEFTSLYALDQAFPLPEPGSYAQIIVDGGTNQKASWDNTNKKWFEDGDFVQPGSDAAYLLKSVYDTDADGVIDKAKNIAAVLTAGGTRYYGTKNGVVGVFDLPAAGTNYTAPAPYTNMDALYNGQADQKQYYTYRVNDASAHPDVNAGRAWFEYTGGTTASKDDYILKSEEESLNLDAQLTEINNRITLLENQSTAQESKTQLLKFTSGWISGYQYQPFAKWSQDGAILTDSRAITLAAADATNDRFDIFVVDLQSEQIQVITGNPAADPVQPSYDPITQIYCGQVRVSANTTQPVDVNEIILYAENAGSPAEWNLTISQYAAGHIVPDDTSDPYEGTYAIKVNNTGAFENFVFTPNTPISIDLIKQIAFRVKNITGANFYIGIEGKKSNGQTDNFYLDDPKNAGYLTNQTSGYQYISQSLPNNQLTEVTRITFIMMGVGEMLFDNIRIISGDAVVVNPTYATEAYVAAEVAKAKQEAIEVASLRKIKTVSTSRNFADTDHDYTLLVTAAVTLTYPALGTLRADFGCEIDTDASGTVAIGGDSTVLDNLVGATIAENSMATLQARPDTGKLRGKGEITLP